jgi:CRP-like cAMP-binding protein
MLRSAKLLRDVPRDVIDRLEACATVRKLGPRSAVIDRDDSDSDVYVVLSGKVRVILYAPSGRVVLLRDLGAGECLGELAAIDGQPRSASVETLTASVVAQIPGNQFRAVAEADPKLAMALLRQSMALIRELTERVYAFSALAVANRIHAELLRLVREASGDEEPASAYIDPAPKHADIADRISTHREAVSREMSRLAKQGLLERQGRRLLVKDVPALARLVEQAGGG